MTQREADRYAHGMIWRMIQTLLDQTGREDLPEQDIVRLDRALERWAHYHFKRSGDEPN
ncbi:MAG: hypothetical protein ACYTEX_24335 [Planctomycetota bacterium]|jgi:hypothetical protein